MPNFEQFRYPSDRSAARLLVAGAEVISGHQHPARSCFHARTALRQDWNLQGFKEPLIKSMF
jgi:hypothetical protein